MTNPLKALVFAAVALAVPQIAPAETGAERIVVSYAEKAIAKGYGSMCSLDMMPVRSGGYYPCLDFGPYRYVRGYESVSAYVVLKGGAPYRVLSGSADSPAFTVAGPWQSDMPMRIVAFWNDVVSGGEARRKETEAATGRQRAAEAYIKSLSEKEKPAESKAVPSVPPVPESKDSVTAAQPDIGKPVAADDLKQVLGTIGQ
jgi:hypothetical protein